MTEAPGAWLDVLAFVGPVANSLECGVVLLDENRRIAMVSQPLASLYGMTVDELQGLSPEAFVEQTARLVDDPPERLRERRMLPPPGETGVVCEEFELARPCRSFVRWVARTLIEPRPACIIVISDITPEVDLTSAYDRQGVVDRLTGLANRRGIEQVVRREMLRARRYATPLSIVLFNIDHFKQLNDTHGHGPGDQLLRQIARGLAGQLRESDMAARWGGEEFMVMLPNTALSPAHACAERIRKFVAKMATSTGVRVSVSGGVAQVMPGENLSDAVSRADALLYIAKAQGRNRIC